MEPKKKNLVPPATFLVCHWSLIFLFFLFFAAACVVRLKVQLVRTKINQIKPVTVPVQPVEPKVTKCLLFSV